VRLRWTQRAARDLLDIARFIARDDPRAARRQVKRLRIRARRALRFPRAGRIVPEVGSDSLREFVEGNYRIVYRITSGTITVIAVFEAHRSFPEGAGSETD